MKALTLTTAADRRKAERSAISEAVRRAMNRVATSRLANPQSYKQQCRDALHSI